ncbi:MAG TPA: class D sortase [Candidatus Dormibacteraeota bacterium]|nr:class D sortase [Candidatus Dormibacteraeota bacterium]
MHRIPAPEAPRRKAAHLLGLGYYFFLAGGILALGYAGTVAAGAYAYQTHEISKFEDSTATLSRTQVPLFAGGVIGEILVPRLGLKVILAEGVSNSVLESAAGHIPETPLPGEWGNVAVAAHRNTFFRPLRKIRFGDVVVLRTPAATFRYRVESTKVVLPTDIEVLNSSSAHTLTLITCFPFNYVGAAQHRFVIRARELRASTDLIPDRPYSAAPGKVPGLTAFHDAHEPAGYSAESLRSPAN